MIDAILRALPSLGISGLLFVMWWFERQERVRGTTDVRDALRFAEQGVELNERLLDVLRANTEAITALREELRSHRGVETEWLRRISRQLESIESR